MREAAEATLAGQVNDWVAVATRHAADVVALCDERDATARAHLEDLEALNANLAALEARMADTVTAAALDRTDLAVERARTSDLEAAVVAYRTIAVNVNAQIVEHADNVFTFASGSRGPITALRKLIGA